ncbi:hypothetical protein GQ44DRAFT_720826 [Phaeosphaeriaceae sp. PMI808]|nr:hypothetical protein GQ44DRAFT_720826 [Phaeosphaeriaceae sp. PMI808]
MGQFLIGSGCRRELMSSYLDETGVSCGDIESAGCDRCGEGEQQWLEEHERWAREWEVVEKVFNELRQGCAICWLVGQEVETDEEEQWKQHRTMQCMAWEGATGMKMVDRTVRNNCRRCWGMDKRCQWPNIVVPLAFAARVTEQSMQRVRECGFKDIGDDEYAAWLGKRHREEVWGQVFSNAMVVGIRLVLGIIES